MADARDLAQTFRRDPSFSSLSVRNDLRAAMSDLAAMARYIMKGTIIIAALAVALTLGLLVFIHESNRPTQPVEQPSPASVSSVQRERAGRALAQQNDPLPPSSEATTNKPAATNLWARFADGDIPKLTREQVEPFLAKNHRSVEALLGALRACGDDELLKEAKEKFPNDPRVQFAAAFKSDSPGSSANGSRNSKRPPRTTRSRIISSPAAISKPAKPNRPCRKSPRPPPNRSLKIISRTSFRTRRKRFVLAATRTPKPKEPRAWARCFRNSPS